MGSRRTEINQDQERKVHLNLVTPGPAIAYKKSNLSRQSQQLVDVWEWISSRILNRMNSLIHGGIKVKPFTWEGMPFDVFCGAKSDTAIYLYLDCCITGVYIRNERVILIWANI